jgi:rubrerythrin
MENQTALDALKMAATNEQKTRQFYLQTCDRVQDSCGREMFEWLAEQEVHHMELIRRVYDSLVGDEGWSEFAKAAAAAEWPLLEQRKASEKPLGPKAADVEILLFATQLENDSHELYASLANETTDPAAKQMYSDLASFEQTHFDLLMANYDHMITTEEYLGLGALKCE